MHVTIVIRCQHGQFDKTTFQIREIIHDTFVFTLFLLILFFHGCLHPDNIIFRGEQYRGIFRQRQYVHLIHIIIHVIPFRPSIRRGECAGRNKHKVFPVLAEIRWTGTEPPVGNLVFLATFNMIHDDVIHRRFRTNVSDIFAIGRPVIGRHGTDTRFFHDLPVPAFHVRYIQRVSFFAPENFLGIRGPFIIEDITFQILDQFPFLSRRHVPEINIEFPVLVGNVTDVFPVRWPPHLHIVSIGRIG